MEQPSWTKGRLDDLNKKVDGGIGRLDEERKELRTEMKEGFAEVDGEIKELRGQTDGRFDPIQRTLVASAALIIVAVIGAAAAIIVTWVQMSGG